jgi:hypothetical protein
MATSTAGIGRKLLSLGCDSRLPVIPATNKLPIDFVDHSLEKS